MAGAEVGNRRELLEGAEPFDRARRALALDLLEAALAAVEPRSCTRRALEDAGLAGDVDGCTVLGFGKAVRGMALGLLDLGRPRSGLLVGPEADCAPVGPLPMLPGGHPLPRADAARTGRRMRELAESLGEADTAICLVSGGASAMLEEPREGVDAEAIREVGRRLLAGGAPIEQINAVRSALSRLKGGGLLRALRPARVCSVVLSDVPFGPPRLVGSGPTLPPGPPVDIDRLVAAYGLPRELPWRPEGAREESGPARLVVAGDNARARAGLRAEAIRRGLSLGELPPLRGEARLWGAALPPGPPGCSGGETTVTLGPERGAGGRNQEAALAWARRARSVPEPGLLLVVGTDGVDGASEHAGALVDRSALRRAEALGLDPEVFLARHDSARFFAEVGAAVLTGPTGTNVADLALRLP